MTIEERKQEFCNLAYNLIGNESITDFLEYWTEHSINGKKMRFEKEKVFDIKRRFATWKRNSIKWDKKEVSHFDKVLNQANEVFKQWENETNN